MRRISLSILYLFSCLACWSWPSVYAGLDSVELLNGETYQLPIVAGKTTQFYLDVRLLPFMPSHVVFQVHSQWYSVKVSFDDDGKCLSPATEGRYSVGTNVGIVSLSADHDPLSWCLSSVPQDGVTFKVLVIALAYRSTDPIPGGCNLELPLRNDPNLYLTTSADQTHIKFAYGDLNVAGVRERCGSSRQQQEPVYDVYQLYLAERHLSEETFFATITRMLKADDIATTARRITRKAYNDKTSVDFVAYHRQGVIYAVVMRLTDTASTSTAPAVAAYVPVVTYSCNFTEDQCAKHESLASQITVAVLGCVGLILCFVGHRLFALELYVFGHLSAQLTVYIMTVRWSAFTDLVCLYISLGAGCLGGLLWLLLWAVVGSPPLSMILVGLCLGYVVSCVVFLITPLTLVDYFLLEYFYQCMFFVVICLVAVIFLAVTLHKLSLLSCAVIGSYLFVLMIDWFLIGSGVQQMVLNSIRKSAIPGFSSAYVTVPYQIADISLYTLWVVLSVAGFFIQCFMERNQPRFPERGGGTERRDGGEPSTDEGRGRVDEEQSERQPLLPAAPAAGDYASVGLQQPSGDMWHSPPNTAAAYTPPPPYS